MSDPFWAMPSIVVMSVWQGLGITVIIFLAGLQAHPAGVLRRGGRGWSRALGAIPPHDAAAADPEHLLHGDPAHHRRVPGVRPGLRAGPAWQSRPRRPSRSSTSSTRRASSTSGWAARAAASWILFLIVAVLTDPVLPVAAPLGALPVTTGAAGTVPAVVARLPRRRRSRGQRLRRAVLITLLIARRPRDDGALLLDDPHVAQDPLRGVRRATAGAPQRRPFRELRDDVERPAGRHVRRHSSSTRSSSRPSTRWAQLVSCSLAAFAFAVHAVPGQGAAVRAHPGDADHPVPGRPGAELHPVPAAAPPAVSTSGNWIGTQEPLWVGAFLGGAFGIFLLRQFFLTDPARARRGRACRRREPVAGLPPHLPAAGEAGPRDPRHLHVHVDVERPHQPADLPARAGPDSRRRVGLAFFQGQFVGKWPEMMAGALVSLAPMIVLFVAAQQFFVRGIALSGLKG